MTAMGAVRRQSADKFWARVEQGDGCWEWRGSKHSKSRWPYGYVQWDGRVQGAHRVAWQIVNGPIPDGLLVLHHCDYPPCVRPSHLFLGNDSANMDDCRAKGRWRVLSGEAVYCAKLTAADVQAIRVRRASGETLAVLSADYGVSMAAIWAATMGRTWKHLEPMSPTPILHDERTLPAGYTSAGIPLPLQPTTGSHQPPL